MARIWQAGFEQGGGAAPHIFDSTGGISPPDFVTSPVAGGWSVYALRLQSDGCFGRKTVTTGTSLTEVYYRGHWRCNDFTGVIGDPTKLPGFYSPSGEQCSLRIDSAGILYASRNGAATLGIGPTLSVNTWYTIEVHVIIHGSTGVFQVKVNGSLVIDLSSQNTKGQSESYMNSIVLWFAGFTKACYYDDVALNDTATATNSSWCGEGAIIGSYPTAAGDLTAMTRGGSDSGANWSQVDEAPPNDATDYNYSITPGQQDLYTLPDLPAAYNTVAAVSIAMRGTLDVPGAGAFAATLKSGGTVDESSNQQQLSAAAWAWFVQVYSVDPTDSGIWTTAKANALQAGVTVR